MTGLNTAGYVPTVVEPVIKANPASVNWATAGAVTPIKN